MSTLRAGAPCIVRDELGSGRFIYIRPSRYNTHSVARSEGGQILDYADVRATPFIAGDVVTRRDHNGHGLIHARRDSALYIKWQNGGYCSLGCCVDDLTLILPAQVTR
jgi:hypothetical protein